VPSCFRRYAILKGAHLRESKRNPEPKVCFSGIAEPGLPAMLLLS
jgi:hypothetical protein